MIKMTQKQYEELTAARDHCADRGMEGFRQWYDEKLNFEARRGALPSGAREYRFLEEERERRNGR